VISFGNYARVTLVGRLTRDPEVKTFANGGKVAKLGFAMSYRKKDQRSGEWVEEPMFIDVDVFNRGENGRDADHCAERLRKGSPVCVEGQLKLEQWEDNSGNKRSRHKVVADSIVFIDPKPADGDGGGHRDHGGGRATRREAPGGFEGYGEPVDDGSIPF
jgi:single-strand DNA-binding protein